VLYDEDNDGLIDYNEFISKVFGHKASFQQPAKKSEKYCKLIFIDFNQPYHYSELNLFPKV